MDYSYLIILIGHTTVWDDRFDEDKEISSCSIPLEWSLGAVNSMIMMN